MLTWYLCIICLFLVYYFIDVFEIYSFKKKETKIELKTKSHSFGEYTMKEISKGIVLLQKKDNCLYSDINGNVIEKEKEKCDKKGDCTCETLNSYSARVYFKKHENEDGTIMLQNLQNKLYLYNNNGTLGLTSEITNDCKFII